MMDHIEARVRRESDYIAQSSTTVRDAAQHFGVSKSTVHKDLTERLPRIDPALYRCIRHVLDVNKAERHLRGGIATMRKYRTLGKISTK